MMVVAGLASSDGRIEESIKIMNWGFGAWQSKALFAAGSNIARAKVQLGSQNYIDLIAPQKISVTLPKNGVPSKAADYKLFVRYEGPIKAPFKKGDRLALLVTKFADGSEQVTPLLAANDVGVAGFFGRALNGLKGLVGIDG